MGFFFKKQKSNIHINLPNPENAKGDWFVSADCCLLCGVPEVVAPELFAYKMGSERAEYCYVKKQPSSEDETKKMLEVVQCAEVPCIRYIGRDKGILNRIKAVGQEEILKDNDLSNRVE